MTSPQIALSRRSVKARYVEMTRMVWSKPSTPVAGRTGLFPRQKLGNGRWIMFSNSAIVAPLERPNRKLRGRV